QPIDTLREPNIIFFQGDIRSPEIFKKIPELVHGQADCVLSDLAPRLSGIRDADTARCLELNRTALTVATTLLRPGGSFLAKGFVNQELHTFTLEIKQHFHSVQRTRPEATRQGSSEFYFFAKDFHVTSNNKPALCTVREKNMRDFTPRGEPRNERAQERKAALT